MRNPEDPRRPDPVRGERRGAPRTGLDLAGLVLAGAAAGLEFPTLIAATPARVGAAHAGNAVGFQIAAAAVGQSAIPSVLGVIGSRLRLESLAAAETATP